MIDRFGRSIEYLRISVTDRCNFRCVYCMPERGLDWLPRDDVLSAEEIHDVVASSRRSASVASASPAASRRSAAMYATIIARVRSIDGVDDIALSTNGVRLRGHGRRSARGRCSTREHERRHFARIESQRSRGAISA